MSLATNRMQNVSIWKRFLKKIFGCLEELNLFALKFHVLSRVAEIKCKFGLPGHNGAFPYEKLIFHKNIYKNDFNVAK